MLRRGMKQREAIRKLVDAGFACRQRLGTGEIILTSPHGGKPIVMRQNRKDLPSEVVHLVNRLMRG